MSSHRYVATSRIISLTTQRLGQLSKGAFLLIGFGITLAGVVIAFVGATQVFVPQDLEFMGTTVAHLRAVNPLLVPLIAHDRAGLGGALTSTSITSSLALLPCLSIYVVSLLPAHISMPLGALSIHLSY